MILIGEIKQEFYKVSGHETNVFVEEADFDYVHYNNISNVLRWHLMGNRTFTANIVKKQIMLYVESIGGYENLPSDEKELYDTYAKTYKIYDYVDGYSDFGDKLPFDVNFTILGLHKKKTFKNGDLVLIEYFAESTYNPAGNEFSIPVVKEEREYIRADNYLVARNMTISWYHEDGTLDKKNLKKTLKYYTLTEAIAAGTKRRTYGTDSLKVTAAYLIAVTEQVPVQTAETLAFPFLSELSVEIGNYISGFIPPVMVKVGSSTTFEELTTYLYGSRIFKDNRCYKCKVGQCVGPWDDVNWEEIFDFSWIENPINAEGVTIRQMIISELDKYK